MVFIDFSVFLRSWGSLGSFFEASWGHLGAIWGHLKAKIAQNGPKVTEDGPKIAQDTPKIPPRWTKIAPTSSKWRFGAFWEASWDSAGVFRALLAPLGRVLETWTSIFNKY